MIYFITKDWANTSSNHAGMQYLCRTLARNYPERYTWIPVPEEAYEAQKTPRNLAERIWMRLRRSSIYRKCGEMVSESVITKLSGLKKGDTVMMMEYLDSGVMLLPLARTIRKNYPEVRTAGMVHLVPVKLKGMFSRNSLRQWCQSVDAILTLGSSLTRFLTEDCGNPAQFHTLFHYVDNYYLQAPHAKLYSGEGPLKVIVMGNQMRDMDTVRETIRLTPDVQFVVCQGMVDMSELSTFPNVELIPFVEENELRSLMASCHVSLNCMTDTIGSNVIVCSMAMGLAMICTDIGSIRDYCSDADTVFIPAGTEKGGQAASEALRALASDCKKVSDMQTEARKRAEDFSIPHFIEAMDEIV